MLRNLVGTALKLGDRAVASNRTLIGNAPSMENVRSMIAKLARSQAPVYVSGESGTGKELVARMIHEQGPRADGPFVAVNCGAIPEELMESELFGHKKGSFTGAVSDKLGLFQAADGGTLFLDEVADLPFAMQVKMLRAMGADLVGMSTALEVIAARHMGVRCLCFSMVANPASDMIDEPLVHTEVLAAAETVGKRPVFLVDGVQVGPGACRFPDADTVYQEVRDAAAALSPGGVVVANLFDSSEVARAESKAFGRRLRDAVGPVYALRVVGHEANMILLAIKRDGGPTYGGPSLDAVRGRLAELAGWGLENGPGLLFSSARIALASRVREVSEKRSGPRGRGDRFTSIALDCDPWARRGGVPTS